MFSPASVILFTGGESLNPGGSTSRGFAFRGSAFRGGLHPGGVYIQVGPYGGVFIQWVVCVQGVGKGVESVSGREVSASRG